MPPKTKEKGKEKGKVKISDKEATRIITEYMKTQNRPYNDKMIFENLHGEVTAAQSKKIMNELADKKILVCKENGKQKIYWYNQDLTPMMDPEELKKLDEAEAKLTQQIAEEKEAYEEIVKKNQKLAAFPTDNEALNEIEELTKENERMRNKIEGFKSNKTVVTVEEKQKAEKSYKDKKELWRKRKRMCMEIVDTISEGMGMTRKAFCEDADIETDETVGVDINEDNTERLRKRAKIAK